jgi:hypothetical protein
MQGVGPGGNSPSSPRDLALDVGGGWRTGAASTTSTTLLLGGLTPDTRYVIRVRRIGRGDFGPVSEGMRTAPSAPGPPAPPVATEVTSSTILLQWQPPAMTHGLPITEYFLEIKAMSGEFTECYRGAECMFLSDGLRPAAIYVFRVSAMNHLGRGEPSACAAFRTSRDVGVSQTAWLECVDEVSRRTYFYHPKSQQSTWGLPKGALIDQEGSFRRRR